MRGVFFCAAVLKEVRNLLRKNYQNSIANGGEYDIIKYSEDQPRDENGRWTDGGGSSKQNAKTKYAPSPQRQKKGIQVSHKKYVKLTGIMSTQYPNLQPEDGEKTIFDANYKYRVVADGFGGMTIHSRTKIE